MRKDPAWRAGDQCGTQKPFIGGFQRLHKLIPSVETVIQTHSASFVVEVCKLALFIFREYMLCDSPTSETSSKTKRKSVTFRLMVSE